jgi:hypothetical protein
MTRRLLNLVTALSLLLFVAVAVVWVRSQVRADHVVYQGPLGKQRDSSWWIDLYTGNVRVYCASCRFPPAGRARFAEGARGGKTGGLFGWTVMRYDNPFSAPDLAGRLSWNFSLPHFITSRDPRTTLWGVAGVTLVDHILELPFWIPAVLFAALPVVRAARARLAAHAGRRGACPACGYNLTGNVSGVCPECGRKVTTK